MANAVGQIMKLICEAPQGPSGSAELNYSGTHYVVQDYGLVDSVAMNLPIDPFVIAPGHARVTEAVNIIDSAVGIFSSSFPSTG